MNYPHKSIDGLKVYDITPYNRFGEKKGDVKMEVDSQYWVLMHVFSIFGINFKEFFKVFLFDRRI